MRKKNRCIRKLFAKFIKTMTLVQHTFLYGKVANVDAFPVFVIGQPEIRLRSLAIVASEQRIVPNCPMEATFVHF